MELAGRDVQLWTARLTVSESAAAHLGQVLSPDERNRALRFRFAEHRRHFIAARAFLRAILGRQLGANPSELEFERNAWGKPALAGSQRVRFNLSHSGGLLLLAVTLDCDIGVDIEQLREMQDMTDVAGRFFCPEEQAELAALPPSDRQRAFFSCWTRKEAFIKAAGQGLSVPLDSFRVSVNAERPAHLHHVHGRTLDASYWNLHDLHVPAGYVAAQAYQEQLPRPLIYHPLTDASDCL
jgi:4'-phosphopantetheinyl transferase